MVPCLAMSSLLTRFYFSCRVFAHVGALAATGNALTLDKAMRQKMWPGSLEECRQLPNIGKQLGSRLAASNMGSLRALFAADPRKIEAVTQRNYPFGMLPYTTCYTGTPSRVLSPN